MPASVTLPVCRDDAASGMKVPAVKQTRIAAEDVLLPFLLRDAETLVVVYQGILDSIRSDRCSTRRMASSLMRACTSGLASPYVKIANSERKEGVGSRERAPIERHSPDARVKHGHADRDPW